MEHEDAHGQKMHMAVWAWSRLLYYFRALAHQPQPRAGVEPYDGWEGGGSGLRGEFAGHYLMAVGAAAAMSADPEERDENSRLTTDRES